MLPPSDLTDWAHPQVRAAVRAVVAGVHRVLDDNSRIAGRDVTGMTGDELADLVATQVRRLQTDATTLSGDLEPAQRRTVWSTTMHAAVAELGGLGRLQRLLDDDTIQDLHINGSDWVWAIRTDGTKTRLAPVADGDDELIDLGRRIARNHSAKGEQEWSQTAPVAEVTLASGHRIELVRDVTETPSITIRRPNLNLRTLDQLVALGSVHSQVAAYLSAAVRAGLNVLVAGGTGAGKTTTCRVLINEIDPDERIITIEDARELCITHEAMVNHHGDPLHPDAVEITTRRPNAEDAGAFTLADGLRASKRMNPDRVIVGEVRSVEAAEMLDAMLGEAGGSMCTLHAESARAALDRLEYLAAGNSDMTDSRARKMVADAIDIVVYQTYQPRKGRYIAHVVEIDGIDQADGVIRLHQVYHVDPDGRLTVNQGPRQQTLQRLAAHGWTVPTPLSVVQS